MSCLSDARGMPQCMVTLIRQAKTAGGVSGVETRESEQKRQGSTGYKLWKAEWSDVSEREKYAQGT